MRSYLDDDLASIRLVASDMDFTLLADDKSMPNGMPERIAALKEVGVTFAAASGRPLYTLRDLFDGAIEHMAFIADNGGAVARGREVIFSSLIEKEALQELVHVTLDAGYLPIVCGIDAARSLSWGKESDAILREFYHKVIYVDAPDELLCDADKFTIFFPEADSHQAFDEQFNPLFGTQLSVTCGGDYWIDVMNFGVTKGTGLTKLSESLGIPLADVAAFGDTDNDVPMLEAAGHSFLVANAERRMKSHARFGAPSNNERGVATVIDAILAAKRH